MYAEKVVFFKGIVEASEGLTQAHSEGGWDLQIASPSDRVEELTQWMQKLKKELCFFEASSHLQAKGEKEKEHQPKTLVIT
ncbi:hypothetical protein BCY86_04655 [Pajaroellobacter abortibovis]|uniref:Uncharacterized protein n=2 Tax=Pajaroellobacter abortibovis TaxID=1882918 RepID=A0A1L6MXD2_9BACT|nr:hypothetical protein BCY86_04655 [Pajaroellobacter abortibovis]